MSPVVAKRLGTRLLPLYAAVFLQGFVLWYTIEKFYMRQIGFDDAGIGLMVAAYSAIMLLIETPSGILADRWSRKGVLILASIALALCSIVCGLSQTIPPYLIGAGLWGVFFALYSGTYDSMVYDTLKEEGQDSELYERYYGRVKVADSVALVCGSLLGGLAAANIDIRSPYFLTVLPALLAIVALLIFKEPKLHKKQAVASLAQHVRNTFGAVLQRGQLVFVMTILVVLSALTYGLLEFSQLWWIALAVPIIAYGPANSLLVATIGVGGLAAGYFRMHRYAVMQATLLVMLASAVGLLLSRHPVVTIGCQVVLGVGLIGLTVVFSRLLHDALDSRVRAGASSAVSTLTRVVLIPFALLFGLVSREVNVFVASWLFVALLALCMVVVARMHLGRKTPPTGDLRKSPTT